MGRPPIGKEAMSDAERQRRHRARLRDSRPVTKPARRASGTASKAAADSAALQARVSMAKTRSERTDRTPLGGQPTFGGTGSACDINWENHREDDSETDAVMRARAVEWQLHEAERLALEFALCRPGTQPHEIRPKFIKNIFKISRVWKKLGQQLSGGQR
jgi:hypothetical protein